MAAQRIDGKVVAQAVKDELKVKIEGLAKRGIVPGLAVILVGEDPASQAYVGSKERESKKLGIHSEVYRLPAATPQAEVLALVNRLNAKADIHGILVQLPLPDHIDEKAVLNAISPAKDVDGFHPINVGNLSINDTCFVPCTPNGVIRLIESTGAEIKGKNAVVVGRSNIVGKPVAMLLLHRHATVTICHSRTKDLPGVCREADILVVAIGKPAFVTGDWVKEGAVVIDVGINRVGDKLVGDVGYDSAAQKAGYITPVPGGVGPMTIAMLLANTVEAAQR
ncbi:MAG: bifunctional methylenetetrahydrofolate dehydrogenase/methenyltetrahydrofolate cyclohydrolase FolD [Bacillota bacterium]